MPLPKKAKIEIQLTDVTEKAAVIIQPAQLWHAAHDFETTIKHWATLGVSASFALTFLITVVTATDFRKTFFISGAVWKAFFAVGLVASVIWMIISAYKLWQIYRTNGVTSADKFVEKIFKNIK